MTNYEVMFIMNPALDDATKAEVVEMVKTVIAADGEVVEVSDLGMKKLAYPIEKKNEGIYTLVTFKGNTTLPAELNRRLKISENVMRHIIVNLDEK
ncbi:MAG: 30S ribosomal protein S6 [Clostridia bacterium]|nr:30S ribosomal protein S6 [Clostridia bacterium]